MHRVPDELLEKTKERIRNGEDEGDELQCTICLHSVSRYVDDEGGLAFRSKLMAYP